MKEKMEPGPFTIKCRYCDEVITSWQLSATDAPADSPRGLVFCGCGRTGADSLGVKGMGRILERRGE